MGKRRSRSGAVLRARRRALVTLDQDAVSRWPLWQRRAHVAIDALEGQAGRKRDGVVEDADAVGRVGHRRRVTRHLDLVEARLETTKRSESGSGVGSRAPPGEEPRGGGTR